METSMDDTLSIGWTQAQARSRRASYRGALRIALVIETAAGLAALAFPAWLISLLPGGDALVYQNSDWVRAWGLMLLLFVLVQLPGLADPVRNRGANVIGIAGRLLQSAAYILVGGLLWIGIVEGLFFLLLAFLYYRLAIAELSTRP
jgi:hypothetical protein